MTAAITLVRQHDTQPAGLVFVDELPTPKRDGKYAAIAAGLREQPGRWALVKTYDPDEKHLAWRFVNAINSGKYVDMRDGFRAKTIPDGRTTRVYATYMPAEVAR